jgi:predicted GNAT family N-acyltransferase
MKTIIDRPNNIDKDLLIQLVNLVEEGDQVQRHFIERGIETADFIALFVLNEVIVTSATLKNPLKSYKDSVFQLAKADKLNIDNLQELGYIITNPKYEGQKLCQRLLTEFFKIIGKKQMFATTRKPSMAHILTKFGFEKIGHAYKTDLELLTINVTDRKQIIENPI